MRRYIPLVVLVAAAVLLLPALVAAKKKVDAGPLGSADHWKGGETTAMTVEVGRAIERLDPEDNRNTARAGELAAEGRADRRGGKAVRQSIEPRCRRR